MVKHYKHIARSTGLIGYWGQGETAEDATSNMAAAAPGNVKIQYQITRFESDLPFAPNGREARATEADAWVDREGCINWIRCERFHNV